MFEDRVGDEFGIFGDDLFGDRVHDTVAYLFNADAWRICLDGSPFKLSFVVE